MIIIVIMALLAIIMMSCIGDDNEDYVNSE